ncbi:MAG: nucleotidyltransferase domain-containing protein [Clostridiales bacterium]|nr:nucleotidyltransferase domain-containing protein [Clostridiales bacterium]
MENEKMFTELVNGLCYVFGVNIQQIILYGSVVRNESSNESDIDIAIILKNEMSMTEKNDFLDLLSDLDTKYEKIFSVIDISQKNMETWGDILPFYKNIKKEGILLWKAA